MWGDFHSFEGGQWCMINSTTTVFYQFLEASKKVPLGVPLPYSLAPKCSSLRQGTRASCD